MSVHEIQWTHQQCGISPPTEPRIGVEPIRWNSLGHVMQTIGVIGAVNMDIHLFGTHYDDGQGLLTAEHYLAEPGGKGANQARAASRLGASVMLVGRAGDDEFGHTCLTALKSDGVDHTFVTLAEGERTGFVVIDLIEGHHVTRVLVEGANLGLGWEDVEPALSRLEMCDIIITQAEIPGEVLSRLASWCVDTGRPLYLDPSPPTSVSPDVLTKAEVLTPDSAEAGGLTGRNVAIEATARLAAGDLLALGARRVTIKLGSMGTLLAEDGHTELIPTLAVVAQDETGAGDVFMAALAVSRSRDDDWTSAIRFANAASALSVGRPGLGLPSADEVNAAMQGN